MRRILLALALVLMPAIASAQIITVRDIIELSKAGLGEEALIALIEVNPRVFPVDVETLKTLNAAGVATNVITAMIKSGRGPVPQPAPLPQQPMQDQEESAPAPQVVVIDHQDEPRVREVPVAVPVYVAVPVRRSHHDVDVVRPSRPVKPVEPVFWGWGGKLRPDAWQPSIKPQKDAKIEIQKR
jgi:hypothetical protein